MGARTHRPQGVALLEGEKPQSFWCWQGKGLCQTICDMVAAVGWCPNRDLYVLAAHLFSPSHREGQFTPWQQFLLQQKFCCPPLWGCQQPGQHTEHTRACTHFNTGPKPSPNLGCNPWDHSQELGGSQRGETKGGISLEAAEPLEFCLLLLPVLPTLQQTRSL